MQVHDKVIIVTGAGSGIGRELALRLLSKGARVAGVDLAQRSLEETAALAGSSSPQFGAFVADIAQRPIVEALPEQVLARFGAIDGLINNAGIIQPFCRLNDLDYPAIERVFNVNLFGALFVTKALLPFLLRRPEAHIVNVSSMGGFVPVPGQTIYCAAKAAVKLLSEGLAAELLDTKVRVSVVFPGAVATNIRANSAAETSQTANRSGGGKTLAAADAAKIIVRGVERNAPRILVGRDAAFMDKLYRVSPGYAARVIANKMRSLLPGIDSGSTLETRKSP
jgi:NAD(P)-dependent dehydrogenase (short-subunit alcohol dehydrogenase family)